MRIEPGHQGVPRIPGRKPGRFVSRASSELSSPTESSTETTVSAETALLMAGLDDIAEVRPELMEEIQDRLNRGEYLTRDAAERTAASILADLASFIGH